MRKKCLNDFWNLLTWEAKGAIVRGMVITRNIVRQRKMKPIAITVSATSLATSVATTVTATSKTSKIRQPKGTFYEYYLLSEAGKLVKVCKKFFLNTFNIRHAQLGCWLSEDTAAETSKKGSNNVEKDLVHDWIDQLQKVPCHYCRANTSRYFCLFVHYKHGL